MVEVPAPDAIFGSQGITQEDRDYRGSRFSEVKAALFANPYQKVWGAAGEPALPVYKVTNRSNYTGVLPGGRPPQLRLATIRTLDTQADLRWGEDGKGFRRLVRPHGVCVTGVWEITADNPYSGYFKRGSRGLVIARISTGKGRTLFGPRRSYGLVFKLYPTADENHETPLRPANIILADDLGGSTAQQLIGRELTNAPHLTGWNRGNELPILLLEGLTFALADRKSTLRQVHPIAELGKAADEKTNTPAFMRLKTAPGHLAADEEDVRNEVLAYIFDKGNPKPQRTLSFDISVSDAGHRLSLGLFRRQSVKEWQTIGKITFNDGVASYNGDFVIHFHHPVWRTDRNDPRTAIRRDGKKVRWI
ncbi:MAG TPA: hypothetical protein VIC28_06490 [Thermoanaerobaculia bacterium]